MQVQGIWILIILCAVSTPSFSASCEYAKRFLKKIVVTSLNSDEVESVIYGNTEYGYFALDRFSVNENVVTAQIVPPGYRFPLEIYLKKKKGQGSAYLEQAENASFNFPMLPSEIPPLPLQPKNELTKPFYLASRAKINTTQGSAQMAYIVNRQGELVWVFALGPNTSPIDVAKPIGQGRYAFLMAWGWPFIVANFDGQIEKMVVAKEGSKTPALHHDFLLEEDGFIALSYQDHHFSGKPGSSIAPGDYTISRVVRIDLSTASVKTLWDALENEPNLFPKCLPLDGIDWDHANSLHHVQGKGYLISVKHLNTLIFVDESFQFKWSLGDTPGATISTVGTPFHFIGEHNATVLENGNVLLLDNGSQKSRFLEIAVDEKKLSAKLVEEFTPNKPLFGFREGSVHRLENGNTVGFLLAEASHKGKYILEFDPQGRQIAELSLPIDPLGEGYRMVPMESIGLEIYLGKSVTSPMSFR